MTRDPPAKPKERLFLLSVAAGGLVSFLASFLGLLFSYRVIAATVDIAKNPDLDPDVKAALLSGRIDSAIGWNRFAVLAWPTGTLLVSAVALVWIFVRWRRQP